MIGWRAKLTEANATISKDRTGVLIGENGRVKDQIERDLNVILNVDAEAGVVAIRARDPSVDPLGCS